MKGASVVAIGLFIVGYGGGGLLPVLAGGDPPARFPSL